MGGHRGLRGHDEATERMQGSLPCVHTPDIPRVLEGDSPGLIPGTPWGEGHDGKCRNRVPGPGTTCVVGFLQEHLVRLGPQGHVAAVGPAQEDGGGVCRPVPLGEGLRCLSVGQVLRGFRDAGGDSGREESWVCAPVGAHGCERGDTGCLGLGQAGSHPSRRPPFCSVD